MLSLTRNKALLLLIAVCASAPAPAQSGDNFRPVPTFRIDAPVVLVPTTVMDRHGASVNGLRADAFSLLQDNVARPIASFAEQDVPVSIGIVLDTSGSMRNALPRAKDALRAFLSTGNPEDEAFLYTVASRPETSSPFTSDFNSLTEHMLFRDAGGATALVDTIYAAMLEMRHAHYPRKALLVISDGMDNHSRYTARELTSAAVEADIQIYCVSLYDPPRNKKPIELAEERNGINFLDDLAHRTGGFQITAYGGGDITEVAAKVGRAMRNEYLIGFVPVDPADGKWHSVKVLMKSGQATAYARPGFYARD